MTVTAKTVGCFASRIRGLRYATHCFRPAKKLVKHIVRMYGNIYVRQRAACSGTSADEATQELSHRSSCYKCSSPAVVGIFQGEKRHDPTERCIARPSSRPFVTAVLRPTHRCCHAISLDDRRCLC